MDRVQQEGASAQPGSNQKAADSRQALSKSDIENLIRSGICPESAERAGLFRVAHGQAIEYGFSSNGYADLSGIVFPYRELETNRVCAYRLRRDNPELEFKEGVKKTRAKYLSPPGQPNHLYVPPGLPPGWTKDTSIPIVVTEGEKKALCTHDLSFHNLGDAAERGRYASIGISGAWGWRGRRGKEPNANGKRVAVFGPIADLDGIEWLGRKVTVWPDSNIKANPSVHAAWNQLARELTSRGAILGFASCPDLPEINGPDDAIGKYGPDYGLTAIRSASEAATSIISSSPKLAADSVLSKIPNVWTCEAPDIEYAVADFLPVGCITLLSGAPDSYKTFFALAISRALLHADSFLGRPVLRRKVIYCDLENPLSVIRGRLEDLEFDPTPDFHHWGMHCTVPPPQLTDSGLYEELAKSLRPPPVIIIDSFVRFHNAGNENSASEMAAVMAQIRRIANAGAAVLVLHHKGKSETNQYRGSSDIQAGVDISLMLDKDEKNKLVKLTTTKNRLGLPFTITLKLDLQSGGFLVTSDPEQERATQQLETVRSVIEQTPGLCQDEVIRKLKGSVSARRVRELLLRNRGGNWHSRTGPNNRMEFYPGPTEIELEM